MRRTTSTLSAVTALVIAAAVTGCGGSSGSDNSESSDSGGTMTVDGLTINDHGTKDVTGMSELDVEADSYYFEPSVITGTPGQKITLHIENGSQLEHNFTLESQHVDSPLGPHEDVTVHVTIPSSGVAGYFCKYHQSVGMGGGVAVKGASLAGNGGSSGSRGSTY